MEVTEQLLRNHNLLDNERSLPSIFSPLFAKGMRFDEYIRSNAEELYHKWCIRVFEHDMLYGLLLTSSTAKIKKYAKRRDARGHGNNDLVVSQ